VTTDADLIVTLLTRFIEPLTPRELDDVLPLLMRGFSDQEIAEDLVIDAQTVKTHVLHILAKMGVHTRGRAVYAALLLGLVVLDDDDRQAAILALRDKFERRATFAPIGGTP
jgi:DNA-binding NarL/FixJ family response regulator